MNRHEALQLKNKNDINDSKHIRNSTTVPGIF